jgi:acyl carrier protein
MTGRRCEGEVTESRVREWLREHIGRAANLPAATIDSGASFAYFGLNSLQYVELAAELEAWLGREVPPTAAYDFPTIDLLARYVVSAANDPVPVGLSAESWS